MNYKFIEVTDQSTENRFIQFPVDLYKQTPNWVRPLDNDIRGVFNKDKNPCFKKGEAIRWILVDENNKTVGRIAAFINGKTAYIEEYKVGQMGFFESIDSQEVAFMLFDKAAEWLKEKGMDCMEGPVNFGERIEWWGLLVEGFDQTPNYGMPYTHPYYIKFFDAYGFKDFFKQFTYRTKLLMDNVSPLLIWKSSRLLKNGDYSVKTYGDIGKAKAIDALLEVYNKAWNMEVHGVDGITREQVETIYKNLQPIIDKDLIYFAFHKDQPIGFFLMFPEINQILKHMNGKLDLIGTLTFLYYKKIKKVDTALGQLFGVVPEFQGKGVEAAMIISFVERIVKEKQSYKHLELNWVGDFNPPMMHLMTYFGGEKCKTHITYRKLFRDDIPFMRSVEKETKQKA